MAVPSPPTGLNAVTFSSIRIDLTWTNGDTYDYVEIWRQTGGVAMALLDTISGTLQSYSDSACAHGTKYYYAVRGKAGSDYSSFSNQDNDTTTLPEPTSLSANMISPMRVDLSWVNGSANYDSIKIERKLSGGSYAEIASITGAETTYQDMTVVSGQLYYYKIRAYHDAYSNKYSDYSNEAFSSITSWAPSSLSGHCESVSSIHLTWRDNSYDEDGFQIYRDGALLTTVGPNIETKIDTGLTLGVTYQYKVRAYKGTIYSAFSNTVNIRVVDIPAAPSLLVVNTVLTTRADLTWRDNSGNETGFKIEESTDGSAFTEIDTVGVNVTFYSRTGLTTGVKRWYKVRAYNSYGNSAYSNTASTTTLAAIAEPSNLQAFTRSNTEIEITFQDNSSAEDDHRLERKPDGGAYAEVATLAANVTYYKDTGRTAATKYWYKVRAKQGAAYSNYSNEDDATTLSATVTPPTGLAISEIQDTTMRLTWTPAAGAAGYKVYKSINGVDYTFVATLNGQTVAYYLVRDLAASTPYWFKILAFSIVGDSAYTAAVTDTTLAQYSESKFEKLLRRQNFKLIHLLEIKPKMTISGFALVAAMTYTYSFIIAEKFIDVIAVYENGVAYTEKTSIAAVEAMAGTFYCNFYDRILYVHTFDGTAPSGFHVQAQFWLYISNYQDGTIIFNGNHYIPLLNSANIPDLGQEVNAFYEGSITNQGWSISLINGRVAAEPFFDKLHEKYTFLGATVVLRMGAPEFAYADFKAVASGIIYEVRCSDRLIDFDIRDIREELAGCLPPHKFTLAEYPNLPEENIDLVIPAVFGIMTGMLPVCIDAGNKIYKCQDGRIRVMTAVRQNATTLVENTDYFVNYKDGTITFAAGITIVAGDIISADFQGYEDESGASIATGAKIFKYILNNWRGLADTELNLDSIFETKYACPQTLGINLYQEEGIDEIFQKIEHANRAFIFQDEEGRIGLKTIKTIPPSNAKLIRDHQIRNYSQTRNRDTIYKKVILYYKENQADAAWASIEAVNNQAAWKYQSYATLELYTYLTSASEAATQATAYLAALEKDIIEFEGPPTLFDLLPGDLFKLSKTRFYSAVGLADNEVIRILGIQKSRPSRMVTITGEVVPQ